MAVTWRLARLAARRASLAAWAICAGIRPRQRRRPREVSSGAGAQVKLNDAL